MKQFIYMLLGLIIIAAMIGFFGYFFYLANDDVKAGLFSFIAVASVAIWNSNQNNKRDREARLFDDKRAAYTKFVALLFEFVNNPKKNAKGNHTVSKMKEFVKDITIWGSSNTVEAYNNYLIEATEGNDEEEKDEKDEKEKMYKSFYSIEKLLRAIRKDLGHNDESLRHGELVGLILDTEGKNNVIGKLDKWNYNLMKT